MIYFFYGAETFLLRQKINYEVGRYKAKYPSGLNFDFFDLSEDQGLAKLKIFLDSCSMFSEKKLAVVENLFAVPANTREGLGDYLGKGSLRKSLDKFLIIAQELAPANDRKKAEKYAFKDEPQKELFKKIKSQASQSEEFDLLSEAKAENWAKKEIEKLGGKIGNPAVKKIIAAVGQNLWRLSSELKKLASYKAGKLITEQDVDLLVKSRIEGDIFKTIDALAARQQALAFKLLYRNLAQGESEIYILSMLIYQFRNLLMVKSQIEQGVPFYGLAKKVKLHPFVLRKTFEQAKNFSFKALKNIYERLLKIDIDIKIGQIEPRAALDLVVGEITG